MTSKTSIIYKNIYKKIKQILLLKEHNYNFLFLQSDFEKSLINEFKNIFNKKINILGCFFHYLKAIWGKLKNLNIKKFKYKLYYNYLIRTFKLLIFLDNSIKIPFFNLFSVLFIEIYVNIFIDSSDRKNFVCFINYFRAVWINYQQYWESSSNEINFTRTNNPCEIFHRSLNYEISMKNPKIAYLIDILYKITQNEYSKYTLNIGSPNKKNKTDEISHKNCIENFKEIVVKFLQHKDIGILFNENFYNEDDREIWDHFNEFYFEED